MEITLAQLSQVIAGRVVGVMPDRAVVRRVSIDSRCVEPGDVFWTIAGTRYDGADFVAEAIGRGASGIVSHRPTPVPNGVWLLHVTDGQQALTQFAAWQREQFSGSVVGVTGSVGKTTTRDAIAAVLAQQGAVLASPQNFNNHIGLPLAMLGLEPQHRHAVLELGASARGEIRQLAELCRPNVGVITRIGEAHLGGFGSRAAIAEAKAELLAALPADGWAVLNGDDPWLRRLGRRCRAPIVWVGRSADCDLQAVEVNSRQGRLRFVVDDQPFELPVWGRHHLTAALCAIAVGLLHDVSLAAAARGLLAYRPQPMRCQVSQAAGATIINDAYNSNPTSMQAALDLLREIEAPGRRIVICGDMVELGRDAAALHHQMGRAAVELAGVDLLLACGRFAKNVAAGAREVGLAERRTIACREVSDSLPLLSAALQPGDVVLIKGSRVMQMERIVAAIQLTASPARQAA